MIQRKQSLFLLLAFIATVVCLCLPIAEIAPMGMGGSIKLYNLCIVTSAGASYSVCGLFGILVMSAALSLGTIFLFNNRKLQSKFCVCNLYLLIAWYIVLGVTARNTSSVDFSFNIAFAACLPAVAAILVFMARAGVIHDEILVRAADRIR